MIRQEVNLFESLIHRKAARPITDDHRVVGTFHHRFCQASNIFNALDGTDASGTAGRPVHHAGVEFHYTFFVWQAAVTDGIVVGVVFHDGDRSDDGVEGISAGFEDIHALAQRMQAVGGGNDHGTLCRGIGCKRR